MHSSEEYDKYRRAKSRKAHFLKSAPNIPFIELDVAEGLLEMFKDLDEDFRTANLHGTGTLRKWSFTMY